MACCHFSNEVCSECGPTRLKRAQDRITELEAELASWKKDNAERNRRLAEADNVCDYCGQPVDDD